MSYCRIWRWGFGAWGQNPGMNGMCDLIRKAEQMTSVERGRRRLRNVLSMIRRTTGAVRRETTPGTRRRPVHAVDAVDAVHVGHGVHVGHVGHGVESRGRSWWCGVLAILLGGMTANGHADLLAGWSFNGVDPAASMFAADEGLGGIDPAGMGGALDFFAGTTINGLSGWSAGESMGFRGAEAEGGSFVINAWPAPGLGLPVEHLVVSFAAKRSSTGCALVRVDHWWNGGWAGVGFATIGTEWGMHQLELPDAAPFTDAVAFRVTVSGSTGSQGTVRFDNVMLHGAPVPAPGSIALLGVGGVVSGARRRRRVT